VRKPLNDFLNTPYGTMPSNFFLGPQQPSQDDSFPSHKKRLKKHTSSWGNTSKEGQYNPPKDHTAPTSSLYARRMENYDQYKTTNQSTNG
jgi:hypothetical protein